jgi:hypothetical protein
VAPGRARPAGVTVYRRQAHAEHRPGVARVDHAVVVEPAGQEERLRFRLDLVLHHGPHGGVGFLVVRLAARGGGLAADDRQHAGELSRAHHG